MCGCIFSIINTIEGGHHFHRNDFQYTEKLEFSGHSPVAMKCVISIHSNS